MRTLLGFFLFWQLFSHITLYANTDSLWGIWQNTSLQDTVRLEAMKKYAWDEYMFTQPDSAIIMADIQLKYSAEIGNDKYISSAYNTMGVANYFMGNRDEAIALYDSAYKYAEAAGYISGMSTNLCNKALIYTDQSNFQPALETYFEAVKIFEKMGDSLRLGQLYNNMAIIYNEQGYNDLALEYYQKSLEIKQGLGDQIEIAAAITNLAAFYADRGKLRKAEILYDNALAVYEKENYTAGIAFIYSNKSDLYVELNAEDEKVLMLRLKALNLFTEIGDQSNIAIQEFGLGRFYLKQNKLFLAEKYLNSALEAFLESGKLSQAEEASTDLYKLHAKRKDFEKALTFYEMSDLLGDSLAKVENKDAALKLKYEHDYEKKTLSDSIEFAKKEEVNLLKLSKQEAQIQKDRTQKYALFGGIGLMLIFGGFAYRTYQRKKRDHDVITLQHEELEESHHEIQQSIHYAKRLQNVFLPSDELLNQHFENHFVLFKPKDVVSGDFYWFNYNEANKTKIIAVADCTGHGVPGALVSIVCSNALMKVVKEMQILEPAEILNRTREIVIETFTKAGQDVRDGMDITILSIKDQALKFAGANNGLWLLKGGDSKQEVIEYKANRQSIGWQEQLNPFTQHEVTIDGGDTIYMLTDGYPDQFGGESGKKLKKKALKTFLLAIQSQDMSDQRKLLDQKFEEWRGRNEQIDDVCLMGIRF